jgi:hypothetical protein
MAVDSKICVCVLYLFCNGDNVTNAFTGVSSSIRAPIPTLIFQSRRAPTPLPVLLEGYYEDSTWREKITGAVID